LTPLGTVDFSSYLIGAQSANPDVIIFLLGGDDMLNGLKQAVQFGLDKMVHLAGAHQELEPLEGLPPEARIGAWVMEWYWKQPGVPHVDEFVSVVKKRTGRVPTARTWFGFVSVWTCALAAAKTKSLDAMAMAKALQGFELPPEIGLSPNPAFYRGPEPARRHPLCRQRPTERRRTGRPLQGDERRQWRRCRRHGRGERLQDGVAGVKCEAVSFPQRKQRL
jgi:branched-chain amino acid transport system substrate-binding protein